MKKTTIAKVNGQGFVNGKIPKKVLERNAMDIITCFDYDFDDCCDFVETSSKQTLLNFLREYDLTVEVDGDYEEVVRKYMSEAGII